jgi:hypothetical protein
MLVIRIRNVDSIVEFIHFSEIVARLMKLFRHNTPMSWHVYPQCFSEILSVWLGLSDDFMEPSDIIHIIYLFPTLNELKYQIVRLDIIRQVKILKVL